MRFAFLCLAAISSVQAFFKRGPVTDPCRCEGRWVMEASSWREAAAPSSALKPMVHPITLDVWHSEDNDPKSVRLTLKVANTLSAVLRATGKDFCANEVAISKGFVSTRLFAIGAAAVNEKTIIAKLLADIDGWTCDHKKEFLTLESPDARVTFVKYRPTVQHDAAAGDDQNDDSPGNIATV